MDFESAIKHLIWRFKNFKNIEVGKKDKIAINKIIEFVNTRQNQDFFNNKGFANLYAFCLGYFVKKYKTTIDNPIPHKELHKLIDCPFEFIIEKITTEINLNHKYKILENVGLPLNKHPMSITTSEKNKSVENLKNQLKAGNNNKYFLKGAWGHKEVSEGIKNQIKNFTNGI